MKKFEYLDQATSPDGTVLALYRHDGQYVIRADATELMSTRRHHSEERLAELVCAPLRRQRGARVLIGGLGLGFTLRTALGQLASDARVVVAELMAAVIEWNRNPAYALAGAALDDARVELRHEDVANVLRSNLGTFDAIMLDVDNGAGALTMKRNAGLYREDGIRMAAAALRPGGRLAYWSAAVDAGFEASLRRVGLIVDLTKARASATSGRWHALYVARYAP